MRIVTRKNGQDFESAVNTRLHIKTGVLAFNILCPLVSFIMVFLHRGRIPIGGSLTRLQYVFAVAFGGVNMAVIYYQTYLQRHLPDPNHMLHSDCRSHSLKCLVKSLGVATVFERQKIIHTLTGVLQNASHKAVSELTPYDWRNVCMAIEGRYTSVDTEQGLSQLSAFRRAFCTVLLCHAPQAAERPIRNILISSKPSATYLEPELLRALNEYLVAVKTPRESDNESKELLRSSVLHTQMDLLHAGMQPEDKAEELLRTVASHPGTDNET